MVRIISVSGVVSWVAVAISMGVGYAVSATQGMPETHYVAGLLSSLWAILWLSVMMFHLIYTGSAVKRIARAGLVGNDEYAKTMKFKTSMFPWILSAIVLLVATPTLGAAFDAGRAPLASHHACAWATVIVMGVVVYKSRTVLHQNDVILKNAITAVERAIKKGDRGR